MVKYEELGKGIIKRTQRRVLGLFIDGTGLDRATRRINRKVDMSALVRGVTSGTHPVVARYYTLIPYEDDSRQRAFLDAVARASLRVVVKRLPPKGISRQVSVDVEMAADIIAFALGHSSFSTLGEYVPGETPHQGSALPTAFSQLNRRQDSGPGPTSSQSGEGQEKSVSETSSNGVENQTNSAKEQRIITVVCPGRDLAYPISLVKELGVDTITADFGQFNSNDILKSAAKWIDLSDSETIWRD